MLYRVPAFSLKLIKLYTPGWAIRFFTRILDELYDQNQPAYKWITAFAKNSFEVFSHWSQVFSLAGRILPNTTDSDGPATRANTLKEVCIEYFPRK